ncbi:MAG TPA: DNA recombination protein RmuC [Acidimicrobiales bacterium]|nr:DNA recombination protein RmuC [Acidimicrobiales bacterium]
MIVALVVGLMVGAAVGAVVAAALGAARAAARREEERARHAADLGETRAEVASLRVSLEHERDRARHVLAASEEAEARLAGRVAELSRQALEHNTSQFMELADAKWAQTQQAARGDLDARTRAIEEVLTPLRDQLRRYEDGLRRLELDRQGAYARLDEQVKALGDSHQRLHAETRNLVTALRAPATRGRWGELQLRRVVEMAGMLEHCDFEEQVTAQTAEGRSRPDMVVHLAGARRVVVDAKVPLQAFLDANEADDDDTRRAHLKSHARQLRAHVDALAKKAYWQDLEDTPGFVVAFIPGDPLLAAALEHDPSLLEHAVSNHVLLATPTNLIALLHTVARGWQQEALASNARQVQQLGRELYKRLATFGEHLARAGRQLGGAVDAYNKAVGSLERTVLPQARRFQDLGVVGGSDKELPELERVDAVARDLQAAELTTLRAVGEPSPERLELIEGSGTGRADDHRGRPGATAT